MMAALPTCAELAGSRRTTTAITNASPLRVSSAASCRMSARMYVSGFDRRFYPLVVFWSIEICKRFDWPRRRFRFVTMALHHVLAAALAFRRGQFAEERSVVQDRRRVHAVVIRDHERRVTLPIFFDER